MAKTKTRCSKLLRFCNLPHSLNCRYAITKGDNWEIIWRISSDFLYLNIIVPQDLTTLSVCIWKTCTNWCLLKIGVFSNISWFVSHKALEFLWSDNIHNTNYHFILSFSMNLEGCCKDARIIHIVISSITTKNHNFKDL